MDFAEIPHGQLSQFRPKLCNRPCIRTCHNTIKLKILYTLFRKLHIILRSHVFILFVNHNVVFAYYRTSWRRLIFMDWMLRNFGNLISQWVSVSMYRECYDVKCCNFKRQRGTTGGALVLSKKWSLCKLFVNTAITYFFRHMIFTFRILIFVNSIKLTFTLTVFTIHIYIIYGYIILYFFNVIIIIIKILQLLLVQSESSKNKLVRYIKYL